MEVAADIFEVWRWGPSDINDMKVTELVAWHEKALDRYKKRERAE